MIHWPVGTAIAGLMASGSLAVRDGRERGKEVVDLLP
jgi:hypothetical protein